MEAWYMDESDEDQRKEHRRVPNEAATFKTLRKLGVLSWKLDPESKESSERLEAIRRVRSYSYEDVIEVSKDTLPNYEEKIKCFYEEHLHTDEEIRYVLEGSGYFDVRDADDRWIRIACKKGDMIVLPEGIYHRFTLDEGNYIKAMRLFVGEPIWTPYNRPCDDSESRKAYLARLDADQFVSKEE